MKNQRPLSLFGMGALLAILSGCGQHLGLGIYCSEGIPYSDAHPALVFGLTLVENEQRTGDVYLGDGEAIMHAVVIETPEGGKPITVNKSDTAIPYRRGQFGYIPCTTMGKALVEVQSFSVTGSNGKTYTSATPADAGALYDQREYALIGIDVTEK